jgi:hypothetical protein
MLKRFGAERPLNKTTQGETDHASSPLQQVPEGSSRLKDVEAVWSGATPEIS